MNGRKHDGWMAGGMDGRTDRRTDGRKQEKILKKPASRQHCAVIAA